MKAQERIGPHHIAYIAVITGHCNAVNIHEATGEDCDLTTLLTLL